MAIICGAARSPRSRIPVSGPVREKAGKTVYTRDSGSCNAVPRSLSRPGRVCPGALDAQPSLRSLSARRFRLRWSPICQHHVYQRLHARPIIRCPVAHHDEANLFRRTPTTTARHRSGQSRLAFPLCGRHQPERLGSNTHAHGIVNTNTAVPNRASRIRPHPERPDTNELRPILAAPELRRPAPWFDWQTESALGAWLSLRLITSWVAAHVYQK